MINVAVKPTETQEEKVAAMAIACKCDILPQATCSPSIHVMKPRGLVKLDNVNSTPPGLPFPLRTTLMVWLLLGSPPWGPASWATVRNYLLRCSTRSAACRVLAGFDRVPASIAL